MTIRMRLARALSLVAFFLGRRSIAADLDWYSDHGVGRYTSPAGRGECRQWPLGIYRRGTR